MLTCIIKFKLMFDKSCSAIDDLLDPQWSSRLIAFTLKSSFSVKFKFNFKLKLIHRTLGQTIG